MFSHIEMHDLPPFMPKDNAYKQNPEFYSWDCEEIDGKAIAM